MELCVHWFWFWVARFWFSFLVVRQSFLLQGLCISDLNGPCHCHWTLSDKDIDSVLFKNADCPDAIVETKDETGTSSTEKKTTLSEFIRFKRIPRGLRIQKEPTLLHQMVWKFKQGTPWFDCVGDRLCLKATQLRRQRGVSHKSSAERLHHRTWFLILWARPPWIKTAKIFRSSKSKSSEEV